jgi:catalase
MPFTTDEKLLDLSRDVIEASSKADDGIHPEFRPAQAKGIRLKGMFTPSSKAALLTSAPYVKRNSTPVTVRFSNVAGIPTVPDNSHTDIVAHSVDRFPSCTAEGFLEFSA